MAASAAPKCSSRGGRGRCYRWRVKSTLADTLRIVTSLDPRTVDQLYGLEPVYEPADTAVDAGDSAPFVSVQCPFCGEGFETRLDLSAGSDAYTEDCQVCCQAIEFVVQVDAAGLLEGLELRRGD
jgi:Cysteine-rich CPXCG